MSSNQKPQLHQDWIDPHAIAIVRALQRGRHQTYLVGGCVRDLLLGIRPKDFDIATTAKPPEVKRLVYNSYIIGKRFRLVLVKRDGQQFEVATFRCDAQEVEVDTEAPPEDIPTGDNLFGTPEQDARRRDFTVNALFYDPVKNELIDYANGMKDLEAGLVRMIGEPNARLQEDPIRILRAIRLAHKIRFSLSSDLRAAIQNNAGTLLTSALPRRREEFLKFLRLENPSLAFLDAYDLGVLKPIAPRLHNAIDDSSRGEEFLHHLRHFADWHWEDLPVQLFAGLIHAFVRTFIEPNPEVPLRANDLLEHPDLVPLMKDELGMFKFEQSLVTKALQLQGMLNRRKEFEKRGHRRQLALLQNEAFPLAIKFAEKDFSLPSEDRHFWMHSYQEYLPEIKSLQAEERSKRRRRPRRRKKGTNSQAAVDKLDADDQNEVV